MRVTKKIKERLIKGLDVIIRKKNKECFIFFENEHWTMDIVIDGEIQETNFFDDLDDLIFEIKYYF